MRDFDSERQKRNQLRKPTEFKLGGEKFRGRISVRPDVIAAAEELATDLGPKATLEAIDAIMLELIDPAVKGHERYRKVREDATDPVGLVDLIEVMWWLIGENTRRPTEPLSPSTTGRRRTTTPSTGRSRVKA